MTVGCKLALGRGQELKPFFLLNLDTFQRPFSHILDTSVNLGRMMNIYDRLS